MNKISTLFAAALIALNSFSQTAPVPTSWDCSGVLPTGWSQDYLGGSNANQFYTNIFNSPSTSARLDGSNENITIAVNDVPGLVTYYLVGSNAGNPWKGTFKSQWSINGSTWTDMRTIVDTLPYLNGAAFKQLVDLPSSQARFIRLIYIQKGNQGGNLAIDDISIAAPTAGAAAEIEANFNNTKVTTGSNIWFSSPVSTATNFKVKLYNFGTDSTLTLSNVTITGTNAADYVLGAFPATIAPNDSGEIDFTFTPSAAGTRSAVLTIGNNDADENPYIIYLNGVGGMYATEPNANPSAINFSNIKSYSLKVGVSGNTSEGYLVLRKEGSAVTDVPADGENYDVGTGVGASKVFYVGSDTSFTVRETHAGLNYHFAVFPYNGVGQYVNYKTASPLAANRTSGAALPGNYYNGIDTANANFPTALGTLINNHSQVFYSNYKSTLIDNFYTRDTVGEQKVVNCEYSGQFVLFTPPFDFTPLNMSREHATASSWMPTFGNAGHEDRYAYSDQHNLRLANQNDVNAPRSNYPFDEIVNQTGNFQQAKFGTDANGKKVFEPLDEVKGDVARSIMYMLTAYNRLANKVGSGTTLYDAWSLDSLVIPGTFPNPDEQLSTRQKQAILKKWHQQDPPSAFERARNEFVQDQQGNRNPFVDHPEWACYIDFNTMRYVTNGCNGTVGIGEIENNIDVLAYPNPAFDKLNISVVSDKTYTGKIEITDIAGRTVFAKQTVINLGDNWFEVDLNDFAAGNYFLSVSGNGAAKKKIQVVK
jgi:endonuclease I